jgi:hypothetical protein
MHLTPAEAGRLLGKSSHEVRDMIARGDLTQEQVEGRWLIPVRDVRRIRNAQRPPAENRQKRPSIKKSRGLKKKRRRKSKRRKSSKSDSATASEISSTGERTHDLAADVSYLEKEIERLNDELRHLNAGLLSDEKRRRIERCQREKKRKGKRLQELRTELSRQEETR